MTTRSRSACRYVGGGRVEPTEEFGRGGHHPHRIPAAPRRSRTAPVASGLVTPRIYTKRGDDGTTGLLFGGRVRKDSWRIELNGAVDEAQAAIGAGPGRDAGRARRSTTA